MVSRQSRRVFVGFDGRFGRFGRGLGLAVFRGGWRRRHVDGEIFGTDQPLLLFPLELLLLLLGRSEAVVVLLLLLVKRRVCGPTIGSLFAAFIGESYVAQVLDCNHRCRVKIVTGQLIRCTVFAKKTQERSRYIEKCGHGNEVDVGHG